MKIQEFTVDLEKKKNHRNIAIVRKILWVCIWTYQEFLGRQNSWSKLSESLKHRVSRTAMGYSFGTQTLCIKTEAKVHYVITTPNTK